MKKLSLVLLCLAFPFLVRAESADTKAAAQTVQHFYDVYVKQLQSSNVSARKYMLRSPALTPAFKDAYKQLMHTSESSYDPIINSSDIPQGGYHVKYASVKNGVGTVLMSGGDRAAQPIKVQVVKASDGSWQINRINHLHWR